MIEKGEKMDNIIKRMEKNKYWQLYKSEFRKAIKEIADKYREVFGEFFARLRKGKKNGKA